MKINEKFLAAYASSAIGIEKEGYLSKKGSVNRGYQRRWFVLKGNLLFYFEKQTDKQPIGVIVLEDCNVDVCDADRFSFSISFFGGDNTRVYVLCAFNEEQMISWMKRITIAPYNYTHMVMTELEKKLARLKENERKAQEEINDLVGATANIDLDANCLQMKTQTDSPVARRKTKKNKSTLDRNTIAVSNHPKSFNNLLTVVTASKNMIQGVRRSKSSENLNKVLQKPQATSPVVPRKKVYQSIRRKVKGTTLIDVADSTPLKECLKIQRKDTFVLLHNRYAASIWTLIKEFEGDANEDLMKF